MELQFEEFKLPVGDTVLLNKIAYTGRHCLIRRIPVKMKTFLVELRANAVDTLAYERERNEIFGPEKSTIEEKDREKEELIEAIVNSNKNRLWGYTMNHTTLRKPYRVGLWGQDKFPDIRDAVWHELCMLGLDLYLCPYGNIYVKPSCWLPALY